VVEEHLRGTAMAKKDGNGGATALEEKTTSSAAAGTYKYPHNLEAERSVLGAMLLDNDVIAEVVQVVKATDFYADANQLIFQCMVDMYNTGMPVELTLLVDELRRRDKLEAAGGYSSVASLEQFVFTTGAAPEWAQSVAEKATLRKLMKAADKILRECAEERRAVAEQLDLSEKLIFEISQSAVSRDFVHIGELMGEAITEIGALRAQTADVTGLQTHFIDLDRLLNGLHPSDLLILAARPSIGKTAFALNVMLNIAVKSSVPVAIFSLEMGKEQLNRRLLCCHAGVGGHAVATGHVKESEFNKLREKGSELAQCPIFIDDSPGLSIMQVRSKARRLKAQQPNLGLIVVDYLQLMSGTDKLGGREVNRQQEVSEISRGLKALARELSVPVMALSQLSRNIEQRSGKDKSARPMLSDLRESGAIEQDADVVMFVHRERVETQRDENGRPVNAGLPIETEIIVGKHRNGPIGSVKLFFWAEFTRFTNAGTE
jgi:replicative DNA helicase